MSHARDARNMPPVARDLSGTIAGRFTIHQRIGAGGMGEVYRAEDNKLKRTVAIKRMVSELQFQQHDRQRFLKEAQRAATLSHPNIAAIYDVLEDKGEILLVLEYVDGVTLRHRIEERITIGEFLEIAIQCGEALGAAHEHRIVHGDIKPENIMLTASQRVKILDFGVAKHFAVSDPYQATESLASMGVSLSGTPAYMAPEVLIQKPYDGRADLFSLGSVYYESLGGRQPFQTDSFAGTVGRVLHTEPPPLADLNRSIPIPVMVIVTKLLAKDPNNRYANARELVEDLRAVQRGAEPRGVLPAHPHTKLPKPCPALHETVDNKNQKADLFRTEAAEDQINRTPSFWTDFDHYRKFHRADRNGATYRPDILLVFISGGSATPPWDALPPEVLSTARIDIDVLSTEYSEHKPTAKGTRAAATGLRTLFSTTFAAYRQLLFVAQNADLIIKQMLLEDAADVRQSPTIRFLNDSRLTCRCRIIVSVSKNYPRRGSKFVDDVTRAFDKHIAHSDMDGLPTPEVLHFGSNRSESEARPTGQAHGQSQRSSLPRPLAAFLAERLSAFRSYWAVAVARQTISRTCALDPQIRRLFGNQELAGNAAEVLPSGESQAALLHRLTEAASSPTQQSLCVITGTAGVGKSVLLRMVARRLATIWLRGTKGAPLPIVFPLAQFKLKLSNLNPQYIWQLLVNDWVAWVNDLLSSNATDDERYRSELLSINHTHIYDQLRYSPTALILDSVDEFMLNHPNLSLTDFASLLRFLQTEFSENAQFLIIAAIRSSERDVTLITESESQVLTLRGMALSEAAAIFPSAVTKVGHASDADVQQLLLTPLILSTLENSDLRLKPEAYLNRAALIHAALVAIIASLKRVWFGTPYSASAWINALSLVAWFQYRDLRGDIEDSDVAESAARVVDVWTSGPCSEARMEVVAGFRILLDPQSRLTLLRHSIFFSIGDKSYRLTHKQWGDYLVSHYAVLCIRHGQFDDLSVRALNHDIFIMAGQQLQESDTDHGTVRALVERASTDGRFLIVGNFAQMLGDSFAPLTGDVLDQEILARLHLFPTVVRFALLSALSSRILLNDSRDNWSRHIRSIFLKALSKYAHDERENALVRSMSWCFLSAMTKMGTPWPGLWQSEKQSLDTLSVIADVVEDHLVVNEWQRSVQAAFMRIQFYALEIPSRVISTVHYLYPLVLAYNRDVTLDRTVVVELPYLLSHQRLDAVYQDCRLPEIRAIWNRCKELYGEVTVRTPALGRSS
jgi:serine/threonine protein kinase